MQGFCGCQKFIVSVPTKIVFGFKVPLGKDFTAMILNRKQIENIHNSSSSLIRCIQHFFLFGDFVEHLELETNRLILQETVFELTFMYYFGECTLSV